MNPVDEGNLFSLSDRVAVITGAAKGLGRTLALGLAHHGAKVALIDADPGVQNVLGELEAEGYEGIAGVCDVTNEQALAEFVDKCGTRFGRIDILVCNAGINLKSPALEQKRENFQPVIDVNLIGVFLCCQAVGRVMVRQRRGSIINIASTAGLVALGRGNNFYSATKGAVIAITRELALEWAMHGVRVNAVAPGWFATDRLTRYAESQGGLIEQMQKAVPLGRIGDPRELVGPVVFLASDAASMFTGQTLIVDGGLLSAVRLGST
jgi:NAD(P)-dependent dehydrogenase (short-subunit alcohol dehydrogenase family)